MDMDTVVAAAKWCRDNDEQFFIGGGEPTLHPRFWDIVGQVLKYNSRWARHSGLQPIQLVTNGSQTETALALADLAAEGHAYVRLSRDQFHRPYEIDPKVIAAFTPRKAYNEFGTLVRNDKDGRDTNSDIYNVVPVGRAKRNGWTTSTSPWREHRKGCDASGCMITPDGKMWRCSCRKEQIGDVRSGCTCDGHVISEPGCTVDDGKLVADTTREGVLCRREQLEAEGWLFTGDTQVPKVEPEEVKT